MNAQPEQRLDDPDLPPSLTRALSVEADYALRLRTGEVVHFTRAERYGAFVVLYAPGAPPDPRLPDAAPAFPHGLEVRISDVVWCARAPSQVSSAEQPAAGAAGAPVVGSSEPPPGVRIPLRIKHGDEDVSEQPLP